MVVTFGSIDREVAFLNWMKILIVYNCLEFIQIILIVLRPTIKPPTFTVIQCCNLLTVYYVELFIDLVENFDEASKSEM